MTWLQPWAWLGAATILLPILIHLLGRGQSITHRFPTLRFIDPSRLLPAQRTRLHDVLLMLVRVAILLLATAALAEPHWRGAQAPNVLGAGVTRAIVVDTSMSMGRLTAAGAPGRGAAVETADQLAGEAGVSRRFLTASPAAALDGARSWLAQQSGLRELVVISDFQLGALDSGTIASVEPPLGIRLVPIALTPNATAEVVSAQDGELVTATITQDSAASTVSWRRLGPTPAAASLRWLVGPGEGELAAASLRAAAGIGVPPDPGSLDSVDLVFPAAAERTSVRGRVTPLRAAWMIELVARLREVALLPQIAPHVAEQRDTLTVAVRSTNGSGVVRAGADGSRLLLFVEAPVASPFSAALASTVLRLTAHPAPISESEPLALTAAQLASWERGPASTPTNASESAESASGRWLWAAALIMLLVEGWLRRRRSAAGEVADDVG